MYTGEKKKKKLYTSTVTSICHLWHHLCRVEIMFYLMHTICKTSHRVSQTFIRYINILLKFCKSKIACRNRTNRKGFLRIFALTSYNSHKRHLIVSEVQVICVEVLKRLKPLPKSQNFLQSTAQNHSEWAVVLCALDVPSVHSRYFYGFPSC